MSAKQLILSAARNLRGITFRAEEANCILVLQYTLPLGGCVHATPLFAALHNSQSLPVYVATRSIGLDVLRHNPHIAGLIETPDALSDLPGAINTLRAKLKQSNLRPRWTLIDAGNQRTRIAVTGLAIGAPMAGYSQASGLLHKPLQRNAGNIPMIAENLAIAEAIGVAPTLSEPVVYTSPAAVGTARALLAESNPQSKPVVLFATQGSGGQPTEWHTDRLVAILRDVARRGMLPILVGTAEQAEVIDNFRAEANVTSVSLAGKTNIPALAALLALGDLCIAIDSGPMHIARGTRVPLIVLAPTFQCSLEWLPLHVPTARVLRGPGTAPAPPSYRLDEIEVHHVQAAISELSELYPLSPTAREARLHAITTSIDHKS